jgi:diguanylate cyclase (GGDEF)-like protein/PAS domain S-box-containing protein
VLIGSVVGDRPVQKDEELLRLILGLSTNFILLPPEDIDNGINDVLAAMGRFASVDRSYVFQLSPDGTRMSNTNEWCAPGIEPHAGILQDFPMSTLPWFLENVSNFEVICIPDVTALPAEATAEKDAFLREQKKSVLMVPMINGGSLAGCVGFDSVREKKSWSEDLISLLKIMGEMFVNALVRRQMEEKLRLSEEKYRNIFENCVEGIFQSTPEGRLLSVNPAMAHMHGYSSPEEMVSGVTDMALQLYADPHDRELFKEHIEELGYVEGFETKKLRRDRSAFWTAITARAIKDHSGKTLYYEGTTEDITKRKEMEARAEKERETFKAIFEKAPYGVALVDPDGRYQYVNPEFTGITGYLLEEIVTGRDWFRKAYPDKAYRQTVIERWKRDMEEEAVDRVFKVTCKEGTVKDVEFRPVVLDDGRTVVVLSDITERRRAEQALKESEEKFRTLFEDSKDAIYITDRRGNMVDCNQAFLELFGYSRENLSSLSAKDTYVSEEELEAFKVAIKERGSVRDHEIRLQKKTGDIMDCLLTVTAKREVDGRIVGYQGIVRDVTAFRQAEETIKHLAYHDALTGLPNRVLFNDRLIMAMARARRSNKGVAVMILDLDKFKNVNDVLGHRIGDLLLQGVAERLNQSLRKSDTVARMGGDEFLVVVPEVIRDEDSTAVARKIVESFQYPFVLDEHTLSVTTSVGIAMFPDDGTDIDTLVKNADIALYRAKGAGRNQFRRYSGGNGDRNSQYAERTAS